MKKIYIALLFCLSVAFAGRVNGQVTLQALNTSYEQNFDSLALTGTTNTLLPQGWLFLETGTNANGTYAAGTGSANTGNTYSFGNNNETDRAFGGLQSGSLTPIIGVSFVNQTGGVITSFDLTYRGERWRLGAIAREDRLDFQYSTNATSLSTGEWNNLSALNFPSHVSTGAIGAVDGNASENSTSISSTITGLNIQPGEQFYIRWLDINAAGSDDGLSVDDFSITPQGVPSDQPTITLVPAALNFGDVNSGESDTLSYTVIGSKLTDVILLATGSSQYTLSLNGLSFEQGVTLPDSGGTVLVKFAPTVNGPVVDSIIHLSGSVSKTLLMSGRGFNQAASIIPISQARSQSVGTKVTIAGRITVANEHGNPAYIQDTSGGIPVFDFNLTQAVQIGDSVIVTGPIGVFNDQKQISGGGIIFTRVDVPSKILTPKILTVAELPAHEGELVTITGASLLNNAFVFYPNSTERITQNGNEVDLRIDGDTDVAGLEKPDGPFTITGVIGRFRQNIQILPRSSNDIPGLTEPTPISDSIPATITLDVVNWNLEFFGARREDYPEEFGPADEALQLQNVKQVMEDLHADIFAVQEVSNDSLFAVLASQLIGYNYICSDRFSYSFQGPSSTFPPQKVCFVYDTTVVNVLSARALFESRYDSARLLDQSLLPNYPGGDASSFYSSGRLPFALTVNATVNGITEELTLINIHAKSGAGENDRTRRLYDGAVLKDSLNARYPDKKFIILGDLNDDLDQSITTGQATPYAAFVSDTARYSPITKSLSEAGARSTISFQDVIDHQIISNELQSNYIAGSAQIITPFRSIPNYATTTTDHLPVKTRYLFSAPALPTVAFTVDKLNVIEKIATYKVSLVASDIFATPKKISIILSGDASYAKDFSTQPFFVQNKTELTLPAGDSVVSFSIQVLNDKDDELNETAVFTIVPTNDLDAATQKEFLLQIQDDDVPSIYFTELIQTSKEGSGEQQVKLKLSTPPVVDQQVTISIASNFSAAYGVDYTTTPAFVSNKLTLSVPAGSKAVSFNVTPIADNRFEFLEVVPFTISTVSAGLQTGLPGASIFTILDVRRQVTFATYPNPTSGSITLEANNLAEGEVVYAELRSQVGETLYKGSGSLETLNIGLTTKMLSAVKGVYILTVNAGDEIRTIRLIKN